MKTSKESMSGIISIEKELKSCSSDEKNSKLVELLREVSKENYFQEKDLVIPDNCEKYGFIAGYHNLGKVLYFLADMIEK